MLFPHSDATLALSFMTATFNRRRLDWLFFWNNALMTKPLYILHSVRPEHTAYIHGERVRHAYTHYPYTDLTCIKNRERLNASERISLVTSRYTYNLNPIEVWVTVLCPNAILIFGVCASRFSVSGH